MLLGHSKLTFVFLLGDTNVISFELGKTKVIFFWKIQRTCDYYLQLCVCNFENKLFLNFKGNGVSPISNESLEKIINSFTLESFSLMSLAYPDTSLIMEFFFSSSSYWAMFVFNLHYMVCDLWTWILFGDMFFVTYSAANCIIVQL